MKTKISYKLIKTIVNAVHQDYSRARILQANSEFARKNITPFLNKDVFFILYNEKFGKNTVEIKDLIKWLWTLTSRIHHWCIEDLIYNLMEKVLNKAEFKKYDKRDDEITITPYSGEIGKMKAYKTLDFRTVGIK